MFGYRQCGWSLSVWWKALGSALVATLPMMASVAAEPGYDIALEGVNKAQRTNIQAFLTLYQRREEPFPGEKRLREWAEQGKAEIHQALQPFGYYSAEVELTLDQDGQAWLVRYDITPGEPVLVTRKQFDLQGPGQDDPALRAALEQFPLDHGDPLDHGTYESGVNGLRSAAEARGYFDMEITRRRAEVFPEPYAAKITLQAQTGERYRLGEVRFKQQTESILKESLLRRFVSFKPGELYQTSTLVNFQDGLVASEYYDVVDILPQPQEAGADLQVPIDVELVPNERHRVQVGAGFGTDTGPRARLDWTIRRLNRSGHRLRTEAGVSFVRQGLMTRYEIPGARPATDHYYLSPRIERTVTDTAESKTLALNVGHTQRRGFWSRNLFIEASREIYEVGGTTEKGFFLIPGGNWTRKRSNDPLYPTRGSRLFLETKGTSTAFLSDTSFIQGTLEGKLVRALFSERHRLLVRLKLGFTEVTDFNRLPASLRYFAGGDHSVRGYSYQSLGPVNAEGERTGGRHLMVGSLEYDFRFLDKWSVAVFVDHGNAFNNFNDDRPTSAGGGLRWLSPIGPVRLDFAHGFERDAGDTQLFHLIIGPDL